MSAGKTSAKTSAKILQWLNKNFDIVFLSETHLVKDEKYKLNSYTEYHNPFSTHTDRKARGGVSCFIRNDLVTFVEEIDTSLSDHILVRFTNGNIVFGSYIAPIDSPYCDPSNFSHIANAFVPTDNGKVVFGGGDMNGRVGDLPQQNAPLPGFYRPNCDVTVNDHGNEIMNICKTFGCFVVNNLNSGAKVYDGNFTFQKGMRKAQNDLLLANRAALSAITEFSIYRVGWNPSDHYPISAKCSMTFTKMSVGLSASKDLLTERVITARTRGRKVRANEVDWENYMRFVENDYEEYKDDVDRLGETTSLSKLNTVVAALNNSLSRSAKLATQPSVSAVAEEEVETESELYELATTMLRRYEKAECSIEEFEVARKNAVDHLRSSSSSAERKTWCTILKESNSKALWEKIDWKGSLNKQDSSVFPELEDLKNQFLSKSETSDDSTLLSEVDQSQYVSVLDDDIQIEEIKKAHSVLKEDKSTADGWAKRMVTSVPLCVMLVFQIIYSSILKYHVYPSLWRTTIVNAIFKNKGTRRLAEFYRGISIVYLMAKIFDIILLNRFKQWFKPSDLQTAYQEEKSTADHVFLERCLIAYARKVKEKLFIISIDFDGAFDRISRSVLIKKLCRFGAGAIFVSCIASMYLKTDNIIFNNGEHIMYTLFAGIKQGLPLSPLLFLFYVDDIFTYFDNAHVNVNNVIYEIVHVLMHADDANILASTREIAVQKMKTLLQYCKINCIIPQYKKCEFIAINGDERDTEPLPFGDTTLRHVNHLGTLGSHLSASGKLAEDLKLHMEVRYKSCIKFYNFLRANKLAPLPVKLDVLKACVTNSVLYNCETFGNLMPPDLEKTYTKLLRRTLNVRNNTPALTLYIESGFLPLKALIHARQFKFFKRYRDRALETDSPRTVLFAKLLDEPTSYLQHYLDLHANNVDAQQIYKKAAEDMKAKLVSMAENDQYKYKIYMDMNPHLQRSPFISNLHALSGDIIRFRLGSHVLPIETGRWSRTARIDRLCQRCDELGDERHALFSCTAVDRGSLNLSESISEIWDSDDIFKLFEQFKEAKFLE